MRIKQLLLIGISFWAVVLVIASISLSSAFDDIGHTQEQNKIINTVSRSVFELTILTGDYLLYYGQRAAQQWQKKYTSLGPLLRNIEKNTVNQKALKTLQTRYENIVQLFTHLQHAHAIHTVNFNSMDKASALEKRIVSRVLENIQTMVSVTDQLVKHGERDERMALQYAQNVFIAMAACVCLLLGATWLVMQERIVKPLEHVRTAIHWLGQGDLDSRLTGIRNDEIGEVAHTFNDMGEQLKKTISELERSNKELDDFAYIASHDLKEPLRGIHSYTEFLLEDYAHELPQEAQHKLHTLNRLARRMTALIDALLHFSRLSRTDLRLEYIDLNDVLTDVLDTLHPILQQQSVAIRQSNALPHLYCDRTLIRQVFHNLITNAMKYNDKSQAWIEIGCTSTIPAELPHTASGINPAIYIQDNGIGIRERHKEVIFRIFKRLHSQEKFGGGTGFGLTLVKKIIERHAGWIDLESVYGEGTTFYFMLGESASWTNKANLS